MKRLGDVGISATLSKHRILARLQYARIDPRTIFSYSCPFCEAVIRNAPTPSPEQMSILQDIALILADDQDPIEKLSCWAAPEISTRFDDLFLDSVL